MEQPLSFTNDLTKIGLSESEAIVYETLIYKGERSASMLKRALPASISRPMLYFILDRLVEIGLVIKKEIKGKPASFAAEHPDKIRNLIESKKQKIQQEEGLFYSFIEKFSSNYNLASGKPGVRILEGIAGVSFLYDDIIALKKDILLIRSPLDESHQELKGLVTRQIERQVKNKIHVRAITPMQPETINTYRSVDAERLVERRIVDQKFFNIPAQIIIYGNKVAMTAYEGHLVTTIIDNEAVSKTWRAIFTYLWNASESEHLETISTNN